MLGVLHQYRPVAFWQAFDLRYGKRAVLELPFSAPVLYQPAFATLIGCKLKDLPGRERLIEAGKGAADKQRFLLPVDAQKLICVDVAEKGDLHLSGFLQNRNALESALLF